MKLLNSKSILDCEEYEEQQHNDETIKIANKIINTLADYDCVVVIDFVDEAHKDNERQILSCNLHDFLSTVEYVDIKNGVDITIGSDNTLCLVAHGQTYRKNNELYFSKTEIHILPYVNDFEFLDISNTLEDFLNYSYIKNIELN